MAEGREAQRQGGLGHAVAGDEGASVEADGCETLGEGGHHVRPDHVAADPRGAPGGEVQAIQRQGLGAPGAELIAEGGAVGDAGLSARDQVQPQHGPAHEGRGGQQVQRHLAGHGRQEEPDQAHVVIERQPGDGAVRRPDLQPVFADGRDIGHQGAVGHRHAQREAGAARGELQVGHPGHR